MRLRIGFAVATITFLFTAPLSWKASGPGGEGSEVRLQFSAMASAQQTASGSITETSSTGALLQSLHNELSTALSPYAASVDMLSIPDTAMERFDTLRDRLIERLWQHRVQCRSDIRRSNRDTKLRTTLRCMHTDLDMRRTLLEEEARFMGALPGIPEETLRSFVNAHDALMDAINSVLTAMDTGVFTQEESLRQALGNLAVRYEYPRRLALLQLHSRRILSRMAETVLAWDPMTASDEAADASYHALSCLTTERKALESILTNGKLQEAGPLLEATKEHLTLCRALLQEALDAENGIEPTE